MHQQTVTAYISLGSNLGDRAGNLLLAVRGLLEAHLCVTRLSAIYETEPFEIAAQLPFLNMAAELKITNISPEQMLARMLRVEYLLGRRREKSEKAPRTVDLDLLLFGESQHKTNLLTIPHPQLHLRNFVLVPLAEIAPNIVHPTFRKSIRQLLKASPDQLQVERWQPNRITNFEFRMTDVKTV